MSSLHARFNHDLDGPRALRPQLSPHVTLIFWCNHGRHKGLAACRMVRMMVEESETLKVHGRVRHLGHWDCGSTRNCTCPGEGLYDWQGRLFYGMRDMWARSNVEYVERRRRPIQQVAAGGAFFWLTFRHWEGRPGP